eukprot:8771373-Pyramimonas_sp.AAC.1
MVDYNLPGFDQGLCAMLGPRMALPRYGCGGAQMPPPDLTERVLAHAHSQQRQHTAARAVGLALQ